MTRTQAGANSFEYFHRDHQGSVTKVTNGSGAVIQSLSYDAFGKRRNADWTADPAGNRFNDTHFTKHGYTGHEHLDNVRLIHMNGRVQDPTLGRFISPDPFVQNPANGQNYDRFGYTYNNPLSHTDPTGFIFKKIGRAARGVVRPLVRIGIHLTRHVVGNDLALFVADGTGNSWLRLAAQVFTNFALDRAENKIVGSFNSTGSGGGGGNESNTAQGDPPPALEQRSVLDTVQHTSGALADRIASLRVEMDDWSFEYGYLGFLGNRIVQDLLITPAEEISRAISDGDTGALVLAVGSAVYKPAGVGVKAARSVRPYEVGRASDLRARSRVGDGLDIHHVGQARPLGQVVPGYSRTTAPAIALPRAEHTAIPAMRGPYTGSARDQLARDVRALRNHTNAPNSAIREVIELNKQMYPGAF